MKNLKIKRIEIGKYIKISILMIVFLGLIFNVIILKKELSNKYIYKKKDTLKYTYDSFVNYNVSLLENDIFDKKVLGADRIYITKLVDKVNTNNSFNFNVDNDSNINGTYEVKAILTAGLPDDQKNRVVWDKEYTLIKKTNFKDDKNIIVDKRNIKINKDVAINISQYLDFIKSVNSKYDINYSTLLKITWNIDFSANSEDGKINKNVKHIISIPVDEKQMLINGNLKESHSDSVKKEYKSIREDFYIKVTVLVIFAIILIIVALYLLLFTNTCLGDVTTIEKFENIKKLYGERIVSILKPLNFNNTKMIEVVDIEDLVKISDDLNKPMFYNYSNDDKQNENKSFYILNNDEIYIYKLD